MFRFLLIFIALAALNGGLAAASEKPLPQDLVQYVRDARKLGLEDPQIQQNAVKAGWPAATVQAAIAFIRSSSQPEKSNAVPGEADSSGNSGAPAASSPKPTATVPAQTPPPPAATPAIPGKTPAAGSPGTAQDAPPEAATPTIPRDRGVPDDYVIGAGDVLHISVWKEPEASVTGAVVRPDGNISMPLLKEVQVLGMTPTQIEKVITDQLTKFIHGADVTVVVMGINSKKVYAVGAVRKEGPIPYTYRMSIMQAISEAGGLTDYAKRKKIYVLRHENGREYKLPFNYDAALKGEQMELNILMLPGDTLVVPH
jgi:polysaccharide export outer membrane protein